MTQPVLDTATQLAAVRAAQDPARVAAAWNAWFEDAGRAERVESVRVQRLFYLPGGACHLVYEAVLRRGAESVQQLVAASLEDGGDAAVYLAKAGRKLANGKFLAPALGEAVLHLPELGLVLWTFPNDPKMKTLPLQYAAAAPQALAALQPESGAGGVPPQDAVRTVVRFIPRKRCVLRYEITWAPGTPETVAPPVVYAKVYEDAGAARAAYEVQAALWKASQADAKMLRIPTALGFDTKTWTVFQGGAAGAPLVQEAAHVTPWQINVIGRGLAGMHAVRTPVRAVQSLDDELAKLQAGAAAVAAAHPGVRQAVEAVVARCTAALPQLPRLPLVASHGTFKMAHLLHDGQRMTLVDYDSFVQADPVYDVANFTADLHYLEANGLLPSGRAARLGPALHESWSANVPWGRRDAAWHWMTASLLVRKQALKCVKHLHGDADAKMRRVLADALAHLEEARF